MEFNEFCVSAGEPARATLITLCNELRSGEHRRKTKALSSPAASGRQNKRAAYTHFKPTWTERVRETERWRHAYIFLLTFPGYHPHVKGNEMWLVIESSYLTNEPRC